MPCKNTAIDRATAQITPTGDPADVVSLLAAIMQKGLAPVIIINSSIGNGNFLVPANQGTVIGNSQAQGSGLAEAARKITQSQALTAAEKIKFLSVLYN